jgi:hypothetical protein
MTKFLKEKIMAEIKMPCRLLQNEVFCEFAGNLMFAEDFFIEKG